MRLSISDIRGIAQLATQATAGVTRIAEGTHQSVWSTMGVPGGDGPGRTRGITGLAYRTIHGVTRLVGKGADTALAGVQPWFGPAGDAGSALFFTDGITGGADGSEEFAVGGDATSLAGSSAKEWLAGDEVACGITALIASARSPAESAN